MKCSEIMTKAPECSLPTDTVDKVAQLMKSKSVGSIPIVESCQTNKLLGIITDRDITLRVVAEALNPKEVTAGDVMTRQTETFELLICRDDDNIEKALQLMEQCQVRRIPILNSCDQIVGIIAQADLATRLKEPTKTAEVVERISEPIAKAAVK